VCKGFQKTELTSFFFFHVAYFFWLVVGCALICLILFLSQQKNDSDVCLLTFESLCYDLPLTYFFLYINHFLFINIVGL